MIETPKGSIFIELALVIPVIIIFAIGILCLNRNIAAKQIATETAYEATLMYFRDCPRVPLVNKNGDAYFGKLLADHPEGDGLENDQPYLTYFAACLESSLGNFAEICGLGGNPARCQIGLQVLFPVEPYNTMTKYCGLQTISNSPVLNSGDANNFPNTPTHYGLTCSTHGSLASTNTHLTTNIVCCESPTSPSEALLSYSIAFQGGSGIPEVYPHDTPPTQVVIGYSQTTFEPPMNLFGQITLESTNIMHD